MGEGEGERGIKKEKENEIYPSDPHPSGKCLDPRLAFIPPYNIFICRFSIPNTVLTEYIFVWLCHYHRSFIYTWLFRDYFFKNKN